VLAVVVLIAGALIAVMALNSPPQPVPTTTTPPSATPTPSGNSDGTDYDTAIGCLGGSSRGADAVITAQSLAGHNEAGAIEVASALVRFIYQFPYPSESDAQEVSEAAMAKEADPRDLVKFFAEEPNLSGGVVTDDVPYGMSTLEGVYYVDESADDSVEVSIGTRYVVDGALSSTLRGSLTMRMVWEGDVWKLDGGSGKRSTDELFGLGQPFSGGC